MSKARSTTPTAQSSAATKTSKASLSPQRASDIPQASEIPELADTPQAETAPVGPIVSTRKPVTPAPSAAKIPAPVAAEIRRLAHDLSNALEIIIQASYLLQMTNPEAQAKRWSTMVDQGAQQAATINRKLREYIRNNMTD